MRISCVCAILLVATLCAGCASNLGEKQVVAKKVYESAPEIRLRDITSVRAQNLTVVLAAERIYKKGSPYHESLETVKEYVPYRFGHALGNFGTGVVGAALIPISLPVFALSGMPAKVYRDHLNTVIHNLNIAKANPPHDSYAFKTPVLQKPTGETSLSPQKILEEDYAEPLAETQASITVTDPNTGNSETVTTTSNAKGEFVVDLSKYAARFRAPTGKDSLRVNVLVRCGNFEAAIVVEMFVGK